MSIIKYNNAKKSIQNIYKLLVVAKNFVTVDLMTLATRFQFIDFVSIRKENVILNFLNFIL